MKGLARNRWIIDPPIPASTRPKVVRAESRFRDLTAIEDKGA